MPVCSEGWPLTLATCKRGHIRPGELLRWWCGSPIKLHLCMLEANGRGAAWLPVATATPGVAGSVPRAAAVVRNGREPYGVHRAGP